MFLNRENEFDKDVPSEENSTEEVEESLNEEEELDNSTENTENIDDSQEESNREHNDNSNSEAEVDNIKVAQQAEQKTANDYLDMARRVQADFDNFRRHATENLKKAKIDGQASVIEVFLPCLDTFKEAKKIITDENVLKGVEMIENKINEALKLLGVEKLETIGQVYDPHLHESLAVMRDESKENDIILDEYQAGYKFNDKVLRYAKVIVNKLN